ncbi:MAG: DUF3108 domain-containing protein [Myxococcales bacterium]|nr:DUF3108 domain-containing protein [Myxococcales bacterium]
MRLVDMLRILFVLTLVGCATGAHVPSPVVAADATAPSATELVRPWGIPGETMEYSATLRGLAVGRVITALGRIGWVDGHRSIITRSRGQSTGMIALLAELVWEQTTTIDLDRGHVLASKEETWSVFAGEREHEVRTVDEEGRHDLHSAIAAVRAWRSAPGQVAHLDVTFGHATISSELRDAGHGFLASAGEPAVRYDGVFEDKVKFTAWVSDDIARVPLRFECDLDLFGHLVVELVHYAAPADAP